MDIDTSLLREKFIIREKPERKDGKSLYIVAPSTRMPVTLTLGGLPEEHYIVRTKSTHNCARFVSRMVADYEKHGPFQSRGIKVDWHEMWQKTFSNYDKFYNKDFWVAIYKGGKKIYSEGKYHPVFDVIEKCDAKERDNYEKSLKLAEDAFSRAGKSIQIDHESNVTLVAVLTKMQQRCSMILRSADRTTTFNFSIKVNNPSVPLASTQGLSTAADFLEGVELCYLIGANNARLALNEVTEFTPPDTQARKARARMNEVIAQINSMENRFDVRYRPERPYFDLVIDHAEGFTRAEILASRK